ncbi:MAG: cardiolipin synthase [Bacteroidales bacterium]|nr:MAG: cardiolipin synthase [Bacteroidales bacterium]
MVLGANWEIVFTSLTIILVLLYTGTIIFTVFFVILENRDPVKTISWALFILLIPVIGIVSYIVFGQSFRKQKIFSRKGLNDLERISSMSKNQIIDLPNMAFLKDERIRNKINIIRLLLNNSKALLTERNKIDVMNSGEETFRSIIYELEGAKDHIHMEFYRWESDNIGNRIRDVLVRKARQGITIRIIFDDVGSWKLSKKYIASLNREGIETYAFMPVRFPYFTSKVNFRNHRKIIVIDGTIGFVGGINIADKYIHGNKKVGSWRDTHLRLEGESVHSLQIIFNVDWYFVSGEILLDPGRYFPEHLVDETHLIQITSSGPDSDWSSIMQAFFCAITTAQKTIYITTPYFSPNESILTALKTGALSGVDVRLILPAKSDSTIAYWNSFSYVSELLEAGIKVYLYENGFNHAKLLMVDGIFSTVGTANIDYRSFDLNFEANALIYNETVTRKLEESFFNDIAHSRLINEDEWKNRPKKQILYESLARILGPLY